MNFNNDCQAILELARRSIIPKTICENKLRKFPYTKVSVQFS